MKPKRQTPIPMKKTKEVENLSDLIKNKKTILIASIKNIPASQFQEIVKKLRQKAIIKVPKKNLIFRALDSSKKGEIKKLKEQIKDNVAILFSDLDSFELAAELIKNKTPSKAKIGQEAPEDIEIPEGPTDLVPGPAISELGNLGIQIQIENGKITIKEPKIIVKQNQKISENAANIMNKLNIKPFSIGFIPLVSFDNQENKIYLDIKIDREKYLKELKLAYIKALGFAFEIGYINEETIKISIRKASAQEKRLNRIMSGESEEVIKESPKEEKSEESKENKSEESPSAAGLSSLFG